MNQATRSVTPPTPSPDGATPMQPGIRHDIRHPIATIFLIASTAHAFGREFGAESLEASATEAVAQLERLLALLARHDVTLDLTELTRAIQAFLRDPAAAPRGLAVEDACRAVLGELAGAELRLTRGPAAPFPGHEGGPLHAIGT